MNQTATPPLTTLERETCHQASTNMHFFSALGPLETSTIPTFTELLAQYQASIDKPEVTWSDLSHDNLADPFAIYQHNLSQARPQCVRWLWQKRLPLAGITLLDGDHGCGKSLLALQIAASVSSGHPMPDGTSTIQGGVVIVTPNTDATTTQLQILTALGADLSCVEILSYIQASNPEVHTSGYRPFSIPEDFTRLLQAIKRVNARLIIFDPFISLLSHDSRWTDQRLGHLLADLNQLLIEHHVACLITRNCHAKGGHARPSVLERSDHFETLATSRLLLAPDPMLPDHLLLSHAQNRHAQLTPTLTLQILSMPANPAFPHITILGTHNLLAKDLINYRPDTLHRQLLSQHLLQIITAATDPTPIATLYASSPHSSAFQIQCSLRDLLNMGQIERPTRGFYTLALPHPVPPLNSIATTTLNSPQPPHLNSPTATTPNSSQTPHLNSPTATTPNSPQTPHLNSSAATTPDSPHTPHLNSSATTTPNSPHTPISIHPLQQLPTHHRPHISIHPLQQLPTHHRPHISIHLLQQLPTLHRPHISIHPLQQLPTLHRPPSQFTRCNNSQLITDSPSQFTHCNNSQLITDPTSQFIHCNNSQLSTTPHLNSSAATTPNSPQTPHLNSPAATTPNSPQTPTSQFTRCNNSQLSTDPTSQFTHCNNSRLSTHPPSQFICCNNSQLSTDPPSQFIHCNNSQLSTDPTSQFTRCNNSQLSTDPTSQFTHCNNSQLSTDPTSQFTHCNNSRLSTHPPSQFICCNNSQLSTDPPSQFICCNKPEHTTCQHAQFHCCNNS